MIADPYTNTSRRLTVSVIIPTRNEAGTIDTILSNMPTMGKSVELIFVDGHSNDGTWELLQRYTSKIHRIYQQPGRGKWDAVMFGLGKARGDILMIYDADMSVDIETLRAFYAEACAHKNALIIGSRFVYPQERGAMRLLNHTGNVAFSWIFSRMLQTRITDTLCGTKVFSRQSYMSIMKTTRCFRSHDPYGDFTLLLGAAKLHMPILEVPVAYRARVYGESKISRFRDGAKLLVVLWHAIKDFASTRYTTKS